jgi:hypothetical protein
MAVLLGEEVNMGKRMLRIGDLAGPGKGGNAATTGGSGGSEGTAGAATALLGRPVGG